MHVGPKPPPDGQTCPQPMKPGDLVVYTASGNVNDYAGYTISQIIKIERAYKYLVYWKLVVFRVSAYILSYFRI